MNKKILFRESNGSISLMSINPNITVEDAIKDLPSNVEYRIFDQIDLPKDEYMGAFFDALIVDFNNRVIDFNLDKAKEITKTRLRKERMPFFEKNDIVLRDAIIEQDQEKLDQAIAERNRLRQITDLANSANNLDELINLHP
jgi:hypothetical protein